MTTLTSFIFIVYTATGASQMGPFPAQVVCEQVQSRMRYDDFVRTRTIIEDRTWRPIQMSKCMDLEPAEKAKS